jgi:hypothetical protein
VPGHTLTDAQLDVVIEGLRVAAAASWDKGDCEHCGPVLCDDHRKDAQKGIRYMSLALRLAKAAGP